MPFNYKKEYKSLYVPSTRPVIVEIPKMNFISIKGKGNPNDEAGEYQIALGLLYDIAYTIKMSYKNDYKIDGFFEYVVPPLEGFWWEDEKNDIDSSREDNFNWISMIRLPDFVAINDFEWAILEATKKKKKDFSALEFLTYNEGLCVQCMHIGSYNDVHATMQAMEQFVVENGYKIDITPQRFHHEIYLSDPGKTDVRKLKTVIRNPIK